MESTTSLSTETVVAMEDAREEIKLKIVTLAELENNLKK